MIITLVPMVTAIVTTSLFLFSEAELKWRITAAAVTVVSLALQWIPALQVHFLIPLVLQAGVSIWMIIYFKMEYM